jgi:hypothetical protein
LFCPAPVDRSFRRPGNQPAVAVFLGAGDAPVDAIALDNPDMDSPFICGFFCRDNVDDDLLPSSNKSVVWTTVVLWAIHFARNLTHFARNLTHFASKLKKLVFNKKMF